MGFAVRVADVELTPDDLKPDDVLAGNPVTSEVVLTSDDKVRYGVWRSRRARRFKSRRPGCSSLSPGARR
jgi:hypothetical protein